MQSLRRHAVWIALWLAASLLGAILLARTELTRLREAFETDMRIAHRLLSQRAVQHDAVLATLALLQAGGSGGEPEQRLPSLYPQILSVQRSPGGQWDSAPRRAAEAQSRQLRRAMLGAVDLAQGRYELVLSAQPASYALQMDLRPAIPWSEWPMAPQGSPVRVTLEHAGQQFVLQPGQATGPAWWEYRFGKHLASDSQPFDVVAVRGAGPADLPWGWMLGWSLAAAGALAVVLAWLRQREQRRRAEELLRLGQAGRLNALGELAAGMAHELNQPLTAVLANTQAAGRLLREDPPELDTARAAMEQAAQQARRASEVVARLRRAVERPDLAAPLRPVVLQEVVREALYLVEPEARRRGVTPQVQEPGAGVSVLAEPVGLAQIIHNLLMNALQALDEVPQAERRLQLSIALQGGQGELAVLDSGPGVTPEQLPRLFEPFFTTRKDGLGLGLSLCESLASAMGGKLVAALHPPRGLALRLTLAQAPP
jgi:signal transduction histidine kinase